MEGICPPVGGLRVQSYARRLSSSTSILARTNIVWPSDLPHDPQHQPPILLVQARNLADCLTNCPVAQSLNELSVEQRLPSVQEVGRLHTENARQRCDMAYTRVTDGAGSYPLSTFSSERSPSVMRATSALV